MPLRFDPDSLSERDWELIAEIERERRSPSGLPWAEDVPTLVKLTAWASWGLFLAPWGFASPFREPPDGWWPEDQAQR